MVAYRQMVAPPAGDPEVGAGVPLAAEPGLLQQLLARNVVRHARGLDPVQAKGAEAMAEQPGQCLAHVAAPRMGPADPVADAAGLRRPPLHVAERHPAEQRVVIPAEQQEGVADILLPVPELAADAPTEGAAGERVARPGRLPGAEKLPRERPELGPGPPVAHLRRPEIERARLQRRLALGIVGRAEERHQPGVLILNA